MNDESRVEGLSRPFGLVSVQRAMPLARSSRPSTAKRPGHKTLTCLSTAIVPYPSLDRALEPQTSPVPPPIVCIASGGRLESRVSDEPCQCESEGLSLIRKGEVMSSLRLGLPLARHSHSCVCPFSRYLRIKRKNQTIFLHVEPSDSFGSIKKQLAEIQEMDPAAIGLHAAMDKVGRWPPNNRLSAGRLVTPSPCSQYLSALKATASRATKLTSVPAPHMLLVVGVGPVAGAAGPSDDQRPGHQE